MSSRYARVRAWNLPIPFTTLMGWAEQTAAFVASRALVRGYTLHAVHALYFDRKDVERMRAFLESRKRAIGYAYTVVRHCFALVAEALYVGGRPVRALDVLLGKPGGAGTEVVVRKGTRFVPAKRRV